MIFNINSYTGNPDWSDSPPEFEYTGNYNWIYTGGKDWDLHLLSSGMLTFTKLNNAANGIEVFIAGGGGGGGPSADNGGGGGGYTQNGTVDNLEIDTIYPCTVGEGGSPGLAGGNTSIFGMIAEGGKSTTTRAGGSGGSGGGASSRNTSAPNKKGGSDGGNGAMSSGGQGGTGQGTSTRPFYDQSYLPYCGGGGGGDELYAYQDGAGGQLGGGNGRTDGTPNTGGGGGVLNSGGSGIVMIRNKRTNSE